MVPASRSLIAGAERHAEIAFEHEQLAEQVSGVALALVPVIDLAGIFPRVGDELGEVAGRQRGAGEHDQRIGGERADRLHRARVEGGLGEHEVGDAEGELRRT